MLRFTRQLSVALHVSETGSHSPAQFFPPRAALSDETAKKLNEKGVSLVGSTIMSAFMQAIGMVNDHAVDCFRYKEIKNANNENRMLWLRKGAHKRERLLHFLCKH